MKRAHREEQKGQQERKEGSSGGFRGASLIEEAQTVGALWPKLFILFGDDSAKLLKRF